MDAEILKVVGKIAGIGGISLGVLLLLFRDVIRRRIYPTLTKEQAYKLFRLILILVWSVALAGVAAWAWVSTHAASGSDSGFRALAVHERTSKLRELLSTGSDLIPPAPALECTGTLVQGRPAPSAFAVQQVLALAQIDRTSVVEAIVPLLGDENVTVSSGAVLALAHILAKATSGTDRQSVTALLPRAGDLASPGSQRLNLRGATLSNQDLTPLAGTEVFYGAEMKAADLSRSRLDGITFKTATLKCASFVQASAKNAVFDMADLERTKFWGVSAPGASFRQARLQDSDFSSHDSLDYPHGTHSAYPPANLEDADFGDTQAYGTLFSEARLGGARFDGASLSGTNFRGAYLKGMSRGVSEAYVRALHPAVLGGCIFDQPTAQ